MQFHFYTADQINEVAVRFLLQLQEQFLRHLHLQNLDRLNFLQYCGFAFKICSSVCGKTIH